MYPLTLISLHICLNLSCIYLIYTLLTKCQKIRHFADTDTFFPQGCIKKSSILSINRVIC